MTYRGTVKQGVIVLDNGARLTEGMTVEVRAIEPAGPATVASATIWQSLAGMSGSLPDLPEDAARNLDHYLYGLPKRDE